MGNLKSGYGETIQQMVMNGRMMHKSALNTNINKWCKKDVSYNENDELQTQNKYMKQRWMVWWMEIMKERWERIKGQIFELYGCGRKKNG